MSPPTQTCLICKRVEVVRQHYPGFPPDTAKRLLAKRCAVAHCPSDPQYLTGGVTR